MKIIGAPTPPTQADTINKNPSSSFPVAHKATPAANIDPEIAKSVMHMQSGPQSQQPDEYACVGESGVSEPIL